jgi:hypothetical protein
MPAYKRFLERPIAQVTTIGAVLISIVLCTACSNVFNSEIDPAKIHLDQHDLGSVERDSIEEAFSGLCETHARNYVDTLSEGAQQTERLLNFDADLSHGYFYVGRGTFEEIVEDEIDKYPTEFSAQFFISQGREKFPEIAVLDKETKELICTYNPLTGMHWVHRQHSPIYRTTDSGERMGANYWHPNAYHNKYEESPPAPAISKSGPAGKATVPLNNKSGTANSSSIPSTKNSGMSDTAPASTTKAAGLAGNGQANTPNRLDTADSESSTTTQRIHTDGNKAVNKSKISGSAENISAAQRRRLDRASRLPTPASKKSEGTDNVPPRETNRLGTADNPTPNIINRLSSTDSAPANTTNRLAWTSDEQSQLPVQEEVLTDEWENVSGFRPIAYRNDVLRRLYEQRLARRLVEPGTTSKVQISFEILKDGTPSAISIQPPQDAETEKRCAAYVMAAGPFRPLIAPELQTVHINAEVEQAANAPLQITRLKIEALGNCL